MGQGDSKLLSQQSELSRSYLVDGYQKEENLTMLTCRATLQQYLLREIICNDEQEYLRMIRKVSERKDMRSKFITQLERLEYLKEEGLCSKFYRIFALWQYPRRTLADQVNERALLKLPFTEEELKAILLQVAEGMAVYQQCQQSHECLTTKTILMTEQTTAKVVDILAVPMRTNLDAIFKKRSIRNVYLSPEQCSVIESQELNNFSKDAFKSDVFVLAVIMLECSLLERQDDCFENDFERVNWGRVEKKLQVVEGKYSKNYRAVLEAMLASSPSQRIDFEGLIARLKAKKVNEIFRVPNEVVVVPPQETVRVSFAANRPPLPLHIMQPVTACHSITAAQPRKSFTFTYRQPIQQKQPNFIPIRSKVEPIQRNLPPLIRKNRPEQVLHSHRPRLITFNQPPPTCLIPSQPLESTSKATTPQTHMDSSSILKGLIQQKVNENTLETLVNNQSNDLQTHHSAEKQLELKSSDPTNPNTGKATFAIDRYAEGKRYEGFKVNGKKEGEGKFFLDGKLCFQGFWKEDMMQGQGKLYYESGALAYDGTFQRDRFHGFGKLYNEYPELLLHSFNYEDFEEIEEFWRVYEGYFEDDLKEGKGTLFLTNGEEFEGNFRSDFVEGEGIFTTKDGEAIRGMWHENRLQRTLP